MENRLASVETAVEGIEVTFNDGCKARIPYAEISPDLTFLDLKEVFIPNPYTVDIFLKNLQCIQLPWDFICYYCPQKLAELKA
jgi:hypothetical protein